MTASGRVGGIAGLPCIFVYHEENGAFSLHELPYSAQMPFVAHLPFTVEDFFSSARSDVAWTERRALDALDRLFVESGVAFSVDGAFRRGNGEGRRCVSMHDAGLAFRLGEGLPAEQRVRLRGEALRSGRFSCVQMPYACGRSVHVCVGEERPALGLGDAGAQVFVLQDALINASNWYAGALSGMYCHATARAVRRAQLALGLPVTGRADARFWAALFD